MNLSASSISPTQIHIAGLFAVLLMLTGSGYAVHSSWESRQFGIESSEHELAEVSAKISVTHEERGHLTSMISNLESSVDDESGAVKAGSLNELAARLVAMTEQHDLFIEQFEPTSPIIVNGVGMQPIDIRLQAPFTAVVQWLDQLHELMPDIHIVSLSIRSPSITSPTVITDIRLNWHIPNEN